MIYQVKAKFNFNKSKQFYQELTDGTIGNQKPEGYEIVNSMKMKFDTNAKRWKLNKSISAIRSYGSFLEFGFLVEGKLLDADRSAKNIIYCEGYGYRYVIK